MKITICKDALEQIEARKFKVRTGIYFQLRGAKLPATDPFILKEVAKDCEFCYGCALGSLFLSTILKEEGKLTNNLPYEIDLREKLSNYFSKNEMDLIEDFFEGFGCTIGYRDRIEDFYNSHPDDTERLKIILQNIIDNGHFTPEKLP